MSTFDGDEVRWIRGQASVQSDLWDGRQWGLGSAMAETYLVKGPDTLHPPGGPSRLIIKEPSYVPYASAEVPRHAGADVIFRRVMSVSDCPTVRSEISAGPLAAIALVAAAAARARLWANDQTAAWAALAPAIAAVPGKGGELQHILGYYCARNAMTAEQAAPMAMRDFFASAFAWQFPHSPDGRLHDLCGSVLCLTTAVDFAGAADDSGGSGRAYLEAASEGIACLGGETAARTLREIAAVCAFMRVKDEIGGRSGEIANPRAFVESAGGPLRPDEFLAARWWDTAMVPYYRIILGGESSQHLVDEQGTFLGSIQCGAIKRAIDSIIRYNEIIDLLADCAHGEYLNELYAAMLVGGGRSGFGYAEASARIIDDVLTCNCGVGGHEEAAEVAMGACVWYLMAPRYQVFRQLTSLMATGGKVAESYAWRPPHARLGPVAATILEPGDALHSGRAWRPNWILGRADDPVDRLADRATARIRPAVGASEHVRERVRLLIDACGRLSCPADLEGLAEGWCEIFATTVKTTGPAHPVEAELTGLVGEIWRRVLSGSTNPGDDAELFIRTDRAIRDSYLLPAPHGRLIRRAFFGVISSAVELTGLSPYGRLADGAATLLANTLDPW